MTKQYIGYGSHGGFFPARLRFGAGLPASTWTSRRGWGGLRVGIWAVVVRIKVWSDNSEEVEMIIGDPRRL